MTPLDRHSQLDDERQHLREAAQRLLTGAPQRSSGHLTVSTLATESGVSRQRLYEHHADILAEFRGNAGSRPISPNTGALQEQLTHAHERIDHLEGENKVLQRRITTLSAIITELTLEANDDKLVTLPHGRRRGPR